LLAVGLPLGLMSGLALAVNPDTTTLPNGAELSVQIDNPTDNEENGVPSNADGSAGGTIDVVIDGEASVGQGEPAIHITFVIDVSASVLNPCDSGNILQCQQAGVINVLTDPNIDSIVDVGVSVFGEEGATADMTLGGGDDPITSNFGDAQTVVSSTFTVSGGDGGVAQFTNKTISNDSTNYTEGLEAALVSVLASNAATKRVFFLSDGASNDGGGGFAAALAALAAEAQIDSFAIGEGNLCTDGDDGTLQQMADASGGNCESEVDPADLQNLLPDLIATFLDALQVAVDDVDIATNPEIPPSVDGPVTVPYNATATLGVGTYSITATAEGSDNAGSDEVEADVTKQVLQLIASPFTESNELSEDNAHTVSGQILGGTGPDRNIDFAVSGQNATTANPSNASINATPGGAAVQFSYTVPGNECASLGQDTITVSTTIAGQLQSIDLTKDWVDTIPPVATCEPNGNPNNKEPQAPGKGGQGQNQDGFYVLEATDNLTGESCAALQITVTDDGSGTEFGPFLVGTVIKYTQDPLAIPEQKPIGGRGSGNNANNVDWHIIGKGDALVTAVDGAGNTSDPVSCLVPPPPK
jgi:hypothetical protein